MRPSVLTAPPVRVGLQCCLRSDCARETPANAAHCTSHDRTHGSAASGRFAVLWQLAATREDGQSGFSLPAQLLPGQHRLDILKGWVVVGDCLGGLVPNDVKVLECLDLLSDID